MPIKVLYALDEFEGPIAGTETQFWRLLNGLDRKMIEPGVLLLRPSTFLAKHAAVAPVRVMNVRRMASPQALMSAVSAALWAKREGYQLVHTFLNDTSILLPWAMRLVGIPILISRRDEGFWYTPWALRALRLNRPAVAAVVANSEAVARAVKEAEHYPANKVHVIHNGIDVDASSHTREAARVALEVPADAFVYSVLANLRPLKRIDDVLRAFSKVHQECPETLLLIAGGDRLGKACASHREELVELSEHLELGKAVRFLGSVDDTASLIAVSDVGLLCSETEGLSNSVMQYMLCGKPIIATSVGGNPELVLNGETGMLVNLGDIDGIADAMISILRDAQKRSSMAAASERRITEHFGLPAMLNAHEALYRKLVR